MAVIEKKPTAYKDNKWQYNGGSESLQIDVRERDFWLLWDGHFLQIHRTNTGSTAALCLPSSYHGACIQMSQPLALSGLYPQILSFHKLANFQHLMLASG